MNNLKKCFKLLPYSTGIKKQLFFCGLLILVGVGIEIISGCANVIGGFYIALMGAMPAQALVLVTVPEVVKASPLYRSIAVEFYAILNFVCEIVCFSVVMIIHVIYALVNPEKLDVSLSLVFLVAIVVLVAEIIMPVMYKKYWVGFVVLMICIMGLFMSLDRYIYGSASFHFPIPVYLIVSYLLVVLGLFGGIGVNKLLYKQELDPMCYKNMMKKVDGGF